MDVSVCACMHTYMTGNRGDSETGRALQESLKQEWAMVPVWCEGKDYLGRQRGTEQSRREGQWRSVNKWLNNNKYTNIYTYECHNDAFICKLIKSNQCCGGGGCKGREGGVGSGVERRMVLSLHNSTTLPRLGRWETRPTWTTQLDLSQTAGGDGKE